jgi:Mrp family chromosome partitioning ATPase
VVKLGHLKREKLLKTLESLKMSNLPILGVVANHVPLDPQDAYTYQQYLASAPSTR